MPRKLPPRDSRGKFIKKAPSDEPISTPVRTRESEASTSQSESRDPPIESPSPVPAAVSRSPLVFPPPVRHSIPGAFSPLADSPTESPIKSPIPFSTLIARQSSLLSPSSVPFSSSRTPSPISLPESVVSPDSSTSFGSVAPDLNPDSDSDHDPVSPTSSPSSLTSSQTVSFASRTSPSLFSVNLRAAQFLSSRPDPIPTLYPASFSSISSSSATSSASSQSSFPSSNQTQQPLFQTSTVLPSSTLILTPVVPTQPTTVSTSTQTVPSPPSTVTPAPPLVVPAPPPNIPVPPPAPPVLLPAAPIVPAIVPIMAANPAGPSAMPYVKDNKAPHFSAHPGDSLDDFIREYEELANTCTLNDQQKVETILQYIPHEL